MVSWLASSFLVKNYSLCLASMGTITLQLSINIFFFLISIIKPFGDMILLLINKLALKPLTK